MSIWIVFLSGWSLWQKHLIWRRRTRRLDKHHRFVPATPLETPKSLLQLQRIFGFHSSSGVNRSCSFTSGWFGLIQTCGVNKSCSLLGRGQSLWRSLHSWDRSSRRRWFQSFPRSAVHTKQLRELRTWGQANVDVTQTHAEPLHVWDLM